MTRPFIAAVLLLTLISLTGCCLLAIDCPIEPKTLELRLMRNGKNALFGPDAFLTQDDVKIFMVSGLDLHERPMDFDSINQSIKFNIPSELILKIENLSSDTLTTQLEKISNKDCCDELRIVSVISNGNVICNAECDEIIDLEI